MVSMGVEGRDESLSRTWSFVLVVVSAVAMVAATGCGPNQQTDGCTAGSCQYGVCDEGSGECVNAESCSLPTGPDEGVGSADAGSVGADAGGAGEGDGQGSRDCLVGFRCREGTCEETESCESSGLCDRGVCEGNRCVNPDICQEQADCASGFRCREGECVVAPCDGVDCVRGVCEGGECVNRETCPNESGPTPACLEGYGCADGACRSAEEFCEAKDCERGVCSDEEVACVNADSCSDDAGCVDGYYCDGGECVENACDEQRVVCDRGVCDPETVTCTNPETCDASEQCMPTFACVEGSCVAESDKCGESGCPGNMLCEYDPETLQAECVENPSRPCRDARDCGGDKICRGGTCEEAMGCSEDAFEPNDTVEEATDYFSVVSQRRVRANICSGDTDVYAFDTSQEADLRGRFIVNLSYDRPDVGLGDLTVRVRDDEGETWVEETTDEEGEVHIDERFGAERGGVYTIEVEDAGNVSTAGIDYRLAADIVDFEVLDACETAIDLGDRTRVLGDTLQGERSAVTARCAPESGTAADKVYEFELDTKSYVDIEVEPEAGFDVVASLRERCAERQTERVCADREPAGTSERVQATLEAGTHHLIVQGAEAQGGGDFEMLFRRREAECTDRDNHCADTVSARVCGPEGQSLEEVICDQGCNLQRGECERREGDVCRAAIPVDTSSDFSREINWTQLEDDLDPGSGECLSRESPDSDGPDAVFEIELEANHAMTARLEADSFQNGSLYLLEECRNAASFCTVGVDTEETTEQLIYRNDSGSAEKLFLVADSESETTGASTLEVETDEIICDSNATFCRDGDVQQCNEAGTELEVDQACSLGCQNAACRSDGCRRALEIGNGGSWQFDPTTYSDNYSLAEEACAGTALEGPELVFEVDLGPEEVLEANLDDGESSMNGAMYLTTECGSTSEHSDGCVAGVDEAVGGSEQLRYRNGGGQAETYYLVVDSESTSSSSGGETWDLTAEVKTTNCTPGDASCQDGETAEMSYCGKYGLGEETYTCQGEPAECRSGLGGARCASPTGGECADPIQAADGETKSGDFSGTNDIELLSGSVGECQVGEETEGAETVYEVALQRDDLLRADLETTVDSARMYLLRDCYWERSCQTLVEGGSDEELYYRTTSQETVYLVVDSTDAGSSGDFSVDFEITSDAICIPGHQECLPPSNVAKCADSGTEYAWNLTCNNGCSQAECQLTAADADLCASAPDVGSGTIGTIDMDGLTDDSTAPTECAPDGADGNDAIYQVQADAGDTISASVEVESFDDPVIYLARSCGGCVTGVDAQGGGDGESLEYTVPSGEGGSYYVVFDGVSSFDADELWDIELRVEQGGS